MSSQPQWGVRLYSKDFQQQTLSAPPGETIEFPPGSGAHWQFGTDAVTLVDDCALMTTLAGGTLVQLGGLPFAVSIEPPAVADVAGQCGQCGRAISREETRTGRAFMRGGGPVCIECLCVAPPSGQVLGDRYEILRELGRGAQATIYLAADREVRRPVALKLMHGMGGSVERFLREAKVAGRLHHPNVVQMHDVGAHDDRPYLVMEYVAGESLDRVLADRGPLPETEAVEVTLRVARALQFAQAQEIIHRDIKPANILLCRDGGAKLAGFGLAKQLEDSGLTATGSFLGTIPFCSPEQLQRPKAVDHRADLYSLGATLFQLLSGRLPFEGDSRMNLIYKITSEEPDWEALAGVSERQREVLRRLLEKDREARLQSATDLIELLEDDR